MKSTKTNKKVNIKTTTDDSQTLVLRDQLARVLADYDNLRRRVDLDKKNFEKLANLRLVIKLLPVLDILKKAQDHLKDQGVAVTVKEFEEALKQEGIEEVRVEIGSEFDPELEEVVEVLPGNDDNKIAEVLLSGYKFIDGPVIRHARVKVFKKNN